MAQRRITPPPNPKDTNVLSVELSSYEPRDWVEKTGSGDFVSYGTDNLYPQYLVELFNSSPTHRALCTTIALRVYGDGFIPSDLDSRLLYEKWNLEDELRKACVDLKIQFGVALEVRWSLDRETVANVSHLPFENVRCGEMDDNEEVQAFFYSPNWEDKGIEPTRYGRFNPETKMEEPVQILYVKPFSPGSNYYPKPDYIGALAYIELEKEIGVYHINNIRNGLAPSFAVHFSNGQPDETQQRKIKSRIERELSGPKNAGKFFITFSDSPDKKPTIDTFSASDLDKQYQFLSTETTDKIMIGHRVVSPAMFGVKTAGQLGNVQELEQAAELFDEQVTGPYRTIIKDALAPIYKAAGANAVYDVAEVEVEAANEFTGIQISSAIDVISKTKTGELSEQQAAQILLFMLGFSKEAVQQLFPNWSPIVPAALSADKVPAEVADFLEGESEEDLLAEYELVDERKVDYDQEETLDAAFKLARAFSSNPNGKSKQDGPLIKVRYKYAPNKLGTSGTYTSGPKAGQPYQHESREFCRKMLAAGKVYRKEDIMAASERGPNPGWGPRGANTYDLFLYKGGGSCQHYWMRQTYLKRNNKKLSVNEARRIITALPVSERDQNRLPVNDPKVAKRPRDMSKRGFIDERKFNTRK